MASTGDVWVIPSFQIWGYVSLDLFLKILLFQATFFTFFSIAIFSPYFLQIGLSLQYVAQFQSGNYLTLKFIVNWCRVTVRGLGRWCGEGLLCVEPISAEHYNDVIMGIMASQITSLTSVCSMYRSKKASKLRVTGLCMGNSLVTGEFPAQRASNTENVSIWWRHYGESTWGWSSIWLGSNIAIYTKDEQIPIIFGVWPFWMALFFSL